jgi:serine phosphatase RsbU (regulator of sigma subunit)
MKSPPLILIADDNPANVEIFQMRLEANGYATITAVDGEDALRKVRDRLPDMVLLDVMMPKKDGLAVCREIKSDPSLPFMPVIMVTAKAESKDVVAGLESGGDEYLTKPVDHAALVSRVKSMLRIKDLHDTVLQQSARLKFQLETATKVQSLFWPKMPVLKGGSRVWAVSVPAAYVGGDFYDVIALPDGSLLVYVADVSDKGVPAALIMAALSTRIRSEAQQQHEIDELVGIINASTCRLISEEGFFITIVVGRYWPGSGRIQVLTAGHLPPLWTGDSGSRKLNVAGGIALGVSPEARYEKSEIIIGPGESVLFYTDGILEARNVKGELLGAERLVGLLAEVKGPPWGPGLLEAVRLWQADSPAEDDLTMLEIWRESSEAGP